MSTHTITDEYIEMDHPQHGRVLFVLPTIPENAPFRIREGIARRRIATMTGECPCGGKRDPFSAIKPGSVAVADFPHEPRCPAITGPLVKALRRWAR